MGDRPRAAAARASRSWATPAARPRARTASCSRDTRVDAVEIDGELNEIAEKYFGMTPRPTLHVHAADARPWLRQQEGARFDAISVDAYRQPYIPFYLTTREFFELVRDRLAPGGVVVINVGHPEGQDELEKVLAATMGEAFPYVAARPGRGDQHAARRQRCRRCRPTSLRAAAPRMPRGAPPGRARGWPAGWPPPLRGGDVYTDDKAPVEWLVDKSIVDYAKATSRGVTSGPTR